MTSRVAKEASRFIMSNDLFPFQLHGAEWLCNRRVALLADEMRLGKSPQTVTGADMTGARQILVVAPAVARINWAREFERWSVFSRATQPLLSLSDVPSADVVICSYDYATRVSEKLKRRWDLLVLDEVHFLKTVDARRSHAIFGRDGIVRCANRVWALSGTPAPNHAGELWILLFTFGVTKLSYSAWVERYCETIATGFGDGYKIVGTKRERISELRELLAKVMLRRTMREVRPEVHEPLFSNYVVEPGSVDGLINLDLELHDALNRQRGLVGGVLNQSMTDDEKLRMLEGLAASVSTLRRYLGLQKVLPTLDLVSNELKAGNYAKIVIFCIHKDVVRALAKSFRESGFGVVTLTGESDPKSKQEAQDRFNSDPSIQIFIGNIISAGTNITLAAARDVIFVEQDWVPGNNAQAARRCSHLKSEEQISVRFLAVASALDEGVTRTLARKTAELSKIFG